MMTPEEQARAIAQQDYTTETAEAAERLKNQIIFAERLFQGLLLLNGGAMVALFTLIGNAANVAAQMRLDPSDLWKAFVAFAAGLIATILSIVGGFFSQRYFYDQALHGAWNSQAILVGREPAYDVTKPNQIGNIAMVFGIIMAIGALACFVAGCAFALMGVLPAR